MMKKINYIFIVIALLATAASLYGSFNRDFRIKEMNFFLATRLETWLPFVMIAFFVIVFGSFFLFRIKGAFVKKRLLKEGVETICTILAVEDTGISANMNPYVKITVEVQPGIKTTFQTLVSRVAIPRSGDQIRVLYDPANPTIVVPAN